MKTLSLFFILFSSLTHAATSSIEIMSFNVENLFDAAKDEGKDDWTFLPNKTKGKKEECKKIRNDKYRKECLDTDWTEKKVQIKYNQIQRIVSRDGKKFPDLLALQEVENGNVVSGLAKQMGFSRSITTNGPDKRGVDVALLVRETDSLKVVGFKEHIVEGETLKGKPTRPVLEVELSLDGQSLFVFVNHWPSQSNPSLSRLAAAQTVMKRVEKILDQNEKSMIVVTGDFNTLDGEFPHPFFSGLLEGEKLVDINSTYMSDRSIDYKTKEKMPLGTYFYMPKMQWNMLDHFFVSKNMMDKKDWDADLYSFQIYAPKFDQENKVYKKGHMKGSQVSGAPLGYRHTARDTKSAGYSDHFPVVMQIKKD